MKATPKNVHFLRLVSSIYKVELTGKHSRKKKLGFAFHKMSSMVDDLKIRSLNFFVQKRERSVSW